MDPNANLNELRELIHRHETNTFYEPDTIDRIVELAQALDEWLSKGGFLPKAWRNAVAEDHWQSVLQSRITQTRNETLDAMQEAVRGAQEDSMFVRLDDVIDAIDALRGES